MRAKFHLKKKKIAQVGNEFSNILPKSSHARKVPPPPSFSKRRHTSQWHKNTQVRHSSSGIVKMMIVATPMDEEEEGKNIAGMALIRPTHVAC